MTEAQAAQVPGNSQADTDALVAGLRQHDPAAHAELCSRYGRALHRYLAGCLQGDADLAEDLMVETLAEATRGIARFDPRRGSFTAWLFGIARRLAHLECRRQRRRTSVPRAALVSLEQLPESTSTGDMATSITELIQARQHLAQLRACLSETEMEVLVLHYVYQFSIQEIGGVIGRSGRAVESLLHRAKTKARERLADDA